MMGKIGEWSGNTREKVKTPKTREDGVPGEEHDMETIFRGFQSRISETDHRVTDEMLDTEPDTEEMTPSR